MPNEKKATLAIGVKDRTGAKLAAIGKKFSKLARGVQTVGRFVARNIVAPLAIAAAAIIKVGANFERSMNRVRVVSRLMGEKGQEQFDRLREQAKKLGATTMFTATQVAKGMQLVAQSGFTANQVFDTMPGLVDLAAAAQVDMGIASDITTGILKGYGMEATQTGRIADVLTETFTRTKSTIEDSGAAFAELGPIAAQARLRFEEVSATIGVLADGMIRGSKAGIKLRSMILELASIPSDKSKASILAGLGIGKADIFDATGNMRSLADIIGVFQRQFKGLAGPEILAISKQLFQKRGAVAFTTLITRGSDKIRELERNLLRARGAAKKVGDVSMQGAIGSILALRSAAEGLMIAVSESGLLQVFTKFVKWYTGRLRLMSKAFKDMMTDIEGFWIQTLEGLMLALGKWVLNAGNLIKLALLPFEKLAQLFGGLLLLPVTGGGIVDKISKIGASPATSPINPRVIEASRGLTQPTKVEVTNTFNRVPPGVKIQTAAKIKEPGLPVNTGKIINQ